MFGEMHATLYTDQHALDGLHLIRYAIALGLDPTSFGHVLHGRSYEKRVRKDFLGPGSEWHERHAHLFIDGVRYDGPPDLSS